MCESQYGYLFDIQSFSVHDGPGCRTTMFFSGCPLKCRWCANPESWNYKPHILFSLRMCQYQNNCTACQGTCKKDGLSFDREGRPSLCWDICGSCTSFECAQACYRDALKVCSKKYGFDEIMNIIIRDSNQFRGSGGITFSGGEPLLQHAFVYSIAAECRRRGIHTAIETSAYAQPQQFRRIMSQIDFAFIDIKHMDRGKHFKQTGVYPDVIHRNIRELAASGWKGRLVLRIPMIGGFNNDSGNIHDVITFMRENGLVEINLLPFHRLGESKWDQLGESYAYSEGGDVADVQLEEWQELFLENDIACYTGSETLF